jgi:predicted branched-subunit amino acid permease
MLPMRFIPLVWKQVVRHRTRTLLTVAGVATAAVVILVSVRWSLAAVSGRAFFQLNYSG